MTYAPITSLYNLGCTLVVGTAAVTEDVALTDCEDLEAENDAGTCACGSQVSATLEGMNTQAKCGTCENEWTALDNCTAGCSSAK